MIYNNIVKNRINKNSNHKGFTLIELVVVLALMSILLGITIFSALGWIDWVTFTKENDTAEDIFYAAQNQLTDLDSSGALYNRITSELEGKVADNEGKKTYMLAQGNESVDIDKGFGDLVIKKNQTGGTGKGYDWKTVWIDGNKEKEKRTIYKLRAESGDYTKYINNSLGADDKGAKLLFELVAPYISDKSVLDGAISLEFSPEAAQVFAVCYTDKDACLSYGSTSDYDSSTNQSINICERWVQARKDVMLGYYGVDTMAAKIRGRGNDDSEYKLEIENGQILALVLSKNNGGALSANDVLKFTINGSSNYDGSYDKVLSFTIPVSAITQKNVTSAATNPIVFGTTTSPAGTNFRVYDGYFYDDADAGDISDNSVEGKFKLPVWIDSNKVYIALDAVDVQAQSITFAGSNGLLSEEADKIAGYRDAFANTYSFYRFGLNDVRYITASVDIADSGDNITDSVDARRMGNGTNIYDIYGEGDAPKGERTTFANYDAADYEGDYSDQTGTVPDTSSENVYGIKNARHLYNVRFETDYKLPESTEDDSDGSTEEKPGNIFKLKADVDWNNLINYGGSADGDGINYFLNSLDKSNGVDDGIEFDGLINTATAVVALDYSDTRNCPFPGFRALSKGDVFTQDKAFDKKNINDADSYKISNLKITVTGNIIYGVYGEDVKKKCYPNSVYDFKKVTGLSASGQAAINGLGNVYKNREERAISSYTGYNEARQGLLPLGLFAENLGTIANITLDSHKVLGLEKIGSDIIYSCMVGGFTGDNIGNLDHLTLLDTSKDSNGNIKLNGGNITKVNGRTDVGGILGRQSFVLKGLSLDGRKVPISNMINYGNVSGLENIGGIVGRVFVHYTDNDVFKDVNRDGTDQIWVEEFYQKKKDNVTVEANVKYNESLRVNYYKDGYKISETGTSLSGEKVDRAYGVTISDCTNRGRVSGDELIYKYGIDNTTVVDQTRHEETIAYKYKHCAFIGGIAGITQDGFMIDTSRKNEVLVGGANKATIYSNFYNGKYTLVSIDNCDSYMLYEKSEIDGIVDSINNGATEYDAFAKDYYVGGLVGYSRLTAIKNCNEAPSETELGSGDNKLYPFVLGARYVGGITGCSDLTRYDQPDGSTTDDYAATNYNNVIGRIYVGGATGAFGIGDYNQETFSFRNPSDNKAAVTPSQIDGCSLVAQHILNTGAVLGIKSTATNTLAWENPDQKYKSTGGMEGFTGFIGGINGVSRSAMANCDNLQSEDTKLLMLDLIGFDTENNFDMGSITSDDLADVSLNSKFGGVNVGGITGFNMASGYINDRNKDSNGNYSESEIDAVVFGDTSVGGGLGLRTSEGSSEVFNFYPIKKDNESSGMLVLGNKYVGGLLGKVLGNNTQPFNSYKDLPNEDTTKRSTRTASDGFTVIGQYSVGGLYGRIKGGRYIFYFDGGTSNPTINVSGNVIVGGLVGSVCTSDGNSNNTPSLAVDIANAKVYVDAKCFAGGYFGNINNTDVDVAELMENSDTANVKKNYLYANISNVDVSSLAYAGGIAGLYAPSFNLGFTKNSSAGRTTDFDYLDSVFYEGTGTSKTYTGDAATAEDMYNAFVYNDIYQTNESSNLFSSWTGSDKTTDFSHIDLSGNKCNVSAGIGAGGLYGYVPEKVKFTVSGFNNYASIETTGTISTTASDEVGSGVKLSYLGGVVGRVPLNMTVKNCKNLVSTEDSDPKYKACDGTSYIGGLTEVNTGTITGVKTSAGVDMCINSTVYNNANGGVGAFAGINGTSKNSDVSPATISYCSNTANLSGKYVGGIAATSAGTSKIIGCINHGELNASNADGSTDAGAAGILYNVLASASGKTITLSDDVNTGIMRVDKTAESDGLRSDKAAGIVYNTRGTGVLNLCRNYGTGLANGITSSEDGCQASKIHYCFDASDSTNHIGSVVGTIPTTNMYANFYIGENDSETVVDPENLEESDYFTATQFYSTNFHYHDQWNQAHYNPLDSYELSAGSTKEDISDLVLGDVVFDNPDKHEDYSRWPYYIGNNPEDPVNGNLLTFEIQSVKADGTLGASYADMNDFVIYWDNYTKTNVQQYLTYFIHKDSDYKDEYNYFIGDYEGAISDTYQDIAKDEMRNYTSASLYGYENGYFNSYIWNINESDWWIDKYALSTYGYMVEQDSEYLANYSSWTDEQIKQRYIELLYSNASIHGSNKYNDDDYYKYDRQSANYVAINAAYKSPVTETFFAYALEELLYSTNAGEYGSGYLAQKSGISYVAGFTKDVFLGAKNYNSSGINEYDYFSNYVFSTYCELIYKKGISNPTKDDYINLLYENVEEYGYPRYNSLVNASDYQISYHLIFYSLDEDGNQKMLSTPAMTTQFSGSYKDDKYSMSDFNQMNNVYIEEGFNSSKITKITIIVTNENAYNDNNIGVRAFRWKKTGSEEQTTMPTPSAAAQDPFAGANSVTDVFDIIYNKKMPTTKLILDQEENSPYKLMLYKFDTLMASNTYNPRAGEYLNDFAGYSNSIPRYIVWDDIEKNEAYINFIKNHIGAGFETVLY